MYLYTCIIWSPPDPPTCPSRASSRSGRPAPIFRDPRPSWPCPTLPQTPAPSVVENVVRG